MLSKIKWNRLNTYYKKQNIQLNVQTKNIFIKKQGLKTFSILLHNDFKKDRIVHQQQQQPLSTITRVPLLRNLIAYPNKHQIDHRRNPLYQQHIRSFSGLDIRVSVLCSKPNAMPILFIITKSSSTTQHGIIITNPI